jgi:uncharacterized protein with HEPN domain
VRLAGLSEASRRLPKELKEGEAHVPWRAIAGIGNVLRHDYHEAYPTILWETHAGATAAAQLERAMTTVVHALSDLARVRPSASVIRNGRRSPRMIGQ